MIRTEDGKTVLVPPLTEEDVRSLKLGQQVWLTGTVHVARDLAHKQIEQWNKEGKPLPFDLNGSVVFHAGPTVRPAGESYDIINIGPTTSARMNQQTPLVIGLGGRAIVGKGAMDAATVEAMTKRGCVFLAAAPGCAMIHAERIKRLIDVHWLDLGTTEAVWMLDVQQWGPLTVAMSADGGNLFKDISDSATKKMNQVLAKVSQSDEPVEWDTEMLMD